MTLLISGKRIFDAIGRDVNRIYEKELKNAIEMKGKHNLFEPEPEEGNDEVIEHIKVTYVFVVGTYLDLLKLEYPFANWLANCKINKSAKLLCMIQRAVLQLFSPFSTSGF